MPDSHPRCFWSLAAVTLLIASTTPGTACAPAAQRPRAEALVRASTHKAEACRITGPSASLTLAVSAGTESFAVSVRGARVAVVPRTPDVSSVEVEGALAFEGRAEGIVFFPSAPIVVAGGLVQLGPMSVLHGTSPRGPELVAQSIDIGSNLRLGELSVPCRAIAFIGSGHPSEDAHQGLAPPRLRSPSCAQPCVHYATPEVIDFHATPAGAALVRLTGSTTVFGLDRRGDWTLVATADFVHMDGAQMTGWVEHARLSELRGGVGFTGGRTQISPRQSGQSSSASVNGPGTIHGAAHIDAGTSVFALHAGGKSWATVRDPGAEFEVVIMPGYDRVRVTRAPFIDHLEAAWVSRAAVHLATATPAP